MWLSLQYCCLPWIPLFFQVNLTLSKYLSNPGGAWNPWFPQLSAVTGGSSNTPCLSASSGLPHLCSWPGCPSLPRCCANLWHVSPICGHPGSISGSWTQAWPWSWTWQGLLQHPFDKVPSFWPLGLGNWPGSKRPLWFTFSPLGKELQLMMLLAAPFGKVQLRRMPPHHSSAPFGKVQMMRMPPHSPFDKEEPLPLPPSSSSAPFGKVQPPFPLLLSFLLFFFHLLILLFFHVLGRWPILSPYLLDKVGLVPFVLGSSKGQRPVPFSTGFSVPLLSHIADCPWASCLPFVVPFWWHWGTPFVKGELLTKSAATLLSRLRGCN